MGKITKKPKRVRVFQKRIEVVEYLAHYTCPCCKAEKHGFGPRRNVTRFICECGQELIVET